MIKKIILVTVFLVLSTVIFSQSRLGLRSGVNFTTLTNLESDYSTKFYVGAVLGIKFSEAYSLRPEVTYSRQGTSLQNAEAIIQADSEYTIEGNSKNAIIDFLNVSVINEITTQSNINFLAGPFVGIRINDNINDRNFFEGVFPRIDIGLVVGLGYDISDDFSI